MCYHCPWSPLHHTKPDKVPAPPFVALMLQDGDCCEGRLDQRHQSPSSQHLPLDTGNRSPTVGSPVSALATGSYTSSLSPSPRHDTEMLALPLSLQDGPIQEVAHALLQRPRDLLIASGWGCCQDLSICPSFGKVYGKELHGNRVGWGKIRWGNGDRGWTVG